MIVRLVMLSSLQMAGFLFANKVDLAGTSRDLYVPYESWPTIRGHRIWPIVILALIGVVVWAVNNPEVITTGGIVMAVVLGIVAFLFYRKVKGQPPGRGSYYAPPQQGYQQYQYSEGGRYQ